MNSNRTVHVVTKCCDRPYTTLLHYFITMTILINTYVYFSKFQVSPFKQWNCNVYTRIKNVRGKRKKMPRNTETYLNTEYRPDFQGLESSTSYPGPVESSPNHPMPCSRPRETQHSEVRNFSWKENSGSFDTILNHE